MKKLIPWAKGLLAAFINGAITAIALVVIAPNEFTFADFGKLTKVAVALGLLGMLNYFKRSPFPNGPNGGSVLNVR